jgi:hypothetical protein
VRRGSQSHELDCRTVAHAQRGQCEPAVTLVPVVVSVEMNGIRTSLRDGISLCWDSVG